MVSNWNYEGQNIGNWDTDYSIILLAPCPRGSWLDEDERLIHAGDPISETLKNIKWSQTESQKY